MLNQLGYINANNFNFGDINIWYIFHSLFRLIEVLFTILIFSLIWIVVGGEWLVIVVVVLYLWLAIQQKLMGFGFVVFQNNFLAKLMVFDIGLILVGFNMNKYVPYSADVIRCKDRLEFTFLGCWLLFVRVLLCCTVVSLYYYNGSINNAATFCIIFEIILIVVWFFMLILAIKFYINKGDTVGADEGSNKLNGIDMIKSNDQESIMFCKELGIDVFTHTNDEKYNTLSNFANNVLDAMIISNEIDNYSIIEEWYYSIGMKEKINGNFHVFLSDSLEWI